ncbi:MAG: GntR family transcriptional regulator [Clostridia bacterium]|nr:GntR family transcriptional regulator [Clostridia bacterium]
MGETKPLTTKVYDYVYSAIINGEINANDLLSEAKLAEQLQVSKAPVREALIRLCEENILQVMPRMGYRAIQIAPAQIAQLVEMRILLEGYMLQKAFPLIDEVRLTQLKNLLYRQRKDKNAPQPVIEKWQDNIDFHIMLAGFCGNEYLLDALRRTMKTCAGAAAQCFLNGYSRRKASVEHHDIIIEQLEAGNLDSALEALRQDIQELL